MKSDKKIYLSGMENCKSFVIFEKKLVASHSSQSVVLRMVRQEYQDSINYILERLDKYDAMGSPVWLEVPCSETYLTIETLGEIFHNLNTVDVKSIESILEENKRLKELLEVILAFNHKKGTSIDFYVTGQGERFIKKISKGLFNDFYPDDELLDELEKKHQKSI